MVVYEDSVRRAASQTDGLETRVDFDARHRFSRALKGFSAHLSDAQVAELQADPAVAEVTPDRPVRAQAVELVAGETLPPGVRRVGATSATQARGASSVGVAVLDTGIDLTHPDLNVAAGVNCMVPGAAPQDANGHGTHVAGTIAAKNNGSGVVGVAPNTKLYAVKVLGDNGSGSTSTVLCGIEWVLANAAALGIKVVNMSLGGPGAYSTCASSAEHDAYCRLTQAGVTVVVAAGNDGWDFGASPPDTPAWYPEVLTVTAMADTDGVPGGTGATCNSTPDDRFAGFSNYATLAADAAHTIAAPGVCIRSTYPGGGTATMSGTSMAAPHVAGAVALCLAEGAVPGPCDGKTPAEIITLMRESAVADTFVADLANTNRFYGSLATVPGADTTAPETLLSQAPAATSTTGTASFTFSASEAATFECRLDGAAWAACASPLERTGLADGAHTFSVRATDLAGNTDATPATHTWTVAVPVEAPPVKPSADPAPATPAVPVLPAADIPSIPAPRPIPAEPWFTVGSVTVFAPAADQPPAGIHAGRAVLGTLISSSRTRIDARLVLGRGRASRSLGRLRALVRDGQAGALRIPISAAGRRRLAGLSSVTARLIFTVTTPAGPRTTRRTVFLTVG